MKIKNILYLALAMFGMTLVLSCSDSFLDEKPLDFMGGDNSFETVNDYECSINNMYDIVRKEFYSQDENRPMDYIYGCDLVYDGEPNGTERHTNMISAYHPTGAIAARHWDNFYKLIAECNTVLTRIEGASFSDADKTKIKAKAMFFRGLAYRTLCYLYGGVPITLEEILSPKKDFVRASKEEVLAQAIADVRFAAENLPDITSVKDGEISDLAASHLLSELYISVGDYASAVASATKVIDSPATALMQSRFGSRANETPGDVYWDLFRKNNQNRGAGNTEGLWVIQFETDVPGGSSPLIAKNGTYTLERHHAPMFRDVKAHGLKPFVWPVSDYTGGRGIGWAISTLYFSDEIWKDDWDGDIRNANHNFIRKIKVHNSEYASQYGEYIDTRNPPEGVTVPSRQIYAYQSKCTTPGNHPDGLYADKETGMLTGGAGGTYVDQYMFRLAETYLLRAEAYLKMGDVRNAAADINMVRGRAHARPADESQINLDYILDERMRELGVEERRRVTLMRTGTLYERVMKCNPYCAKEMKPTYEVWPIPFKIIEANNQAVIEQNPGYE